MASSIGKPTFNLKDFLATSNGGRTLTEYQKNKTIYALGDPSDTLFYIVSGKVKLTVVSEHGKEAVIAVLGTSDFFGEGCLNGETKRLVTVSALSDCKIMQVGSSRVDLQACKLEYSIVSPK